MMVISEFVHGSHEEQPGRDTTYCGAKVAGSSASLACANVCGGVERGPIVGVNSKRGCYIQSCVSAACHGGLRDL